LEQVLTKINWTQKDEIIRQQFAPKSRLCDKPETAIFGSSAEQACVTQHPVAVAGD